MIGIKPDVYWIDGPWTGRLAILARPRGADWLEDEVEGWKHAGLDTVVSLLTRAEEVELGLSEEADLVRHCGLMFMSFPIPDYSVPNSKRDMRELVENLADELSRGNKVGIHCRQGIGRSSVVAACVLVSAGESAESAFYMVATARRAPVPDTAEQKKWVASFAA